MRRNRSFHPSREPFRERASIDLDRSRVHGPFSFLNPTRARFRPRPSSPPDPPVDASTEKEDQPASQVSFLWRSRDNRKGRHALRVEPVDASTALYRTPTRTSAPRAVARGVLRMFTYCPYWDISYLVAIIFTLGSVVWVLNGFFVWLPVQDPSTSFDRELLYGGGISAFIGAVVFFEFGSILLMFEAVNENNTGCFGWALKQLESDVTHGVSADDSPIQVHIDRSACRHHHRNKRNLCGRGPPSTSTPTSHGDPHSSDSWQWFPSMRALRDHYLWELGFLASLAQFTGATIFSLAGITALPGINDRLSQPALNVIYWLPQIVGGSGFIVLGTLYMLETQERWWQPALGTLGWHIAFWNLIGALGFTLSGALGPAYGNSGAQYEAGLATFWGSWAFLIGSVIQWYESLDKFPVEAERGDEPRDRDTNGKMG